MTSSRKQALIFLSVHLFYLLTWGAYVTVNHLTPLDQVVNVLFTPPQLIGHLSEQFAIEKWPPAPAQWASYASAIACAYALLGLASFAIFLWGYKKGKLEHRVLKFFCWLPMLPSILFYIAIFLVFLTERFFILVTLLSVVFFEWKTLSKPSNKQSTTTESERAGWMLAAQIFYWIILYLCCRILLPEVRFAPSGEFTIAEFYTLGYLLLLGLYAILVIVSTSLYVWAWKKGLLGNFMISKICSLPMIGPLVCIIGILVEATRPMLVAKPVIYLYPEETTDVSVKLDYDGVLDCTYPAYNGGWSVTAHPDERLVNHVDGLEYSYLFWEGRSNPSYDLTSGFVVKGADTAVFLQQKLSQIGLLPKEYNEFIVFWLPLMQNNAYNLVTFQGEAYTRHTPLTIAPVPDSVLRVFMVYKPLKSPIAIQPQELNSFERKGFCVIEWGGSVVK